MHASLIGLAPSFTDGERDVKKLFILGLALFLQGCDNKPVAPFGFKWGQTVEQTINQNLEGAEISDKNDVIAFISADSAPEPVQYEGRYYLSFMKGLGLTSASFSTNVDRNSYFFNQGRNIYSSISQKLEEKYGAPVKINENVSRDGNEFYECLKHESCGQWSREYSKDGMKVILRVESAPGSLMDDFPKGTVSVRYEYFSKEMMQKLNAEEEKKQKSNNF